MSVVIAVLEWLSQFGALGIFLGLMIEIIPSEIVLGYGGYLVSIGKTSFTGAIIAGVVGGTLAHIVLYYVGAYAGRAFVIKYGKYLLLKEKYLIISEKWFARHGGIVVFTARFVPAVRHIVSIPAGMSKMNLSYFTLLTFLAAIPWSISFIYLGYALKENWSHIEEEASTYIWICASIVLVIAIAYSLCQIFKSRKRKAE